MSMSTTSTLWNRLVRSAPGLSLDELIKIVHEHRLASIRKKAFDRFFKKLPEVWEVVRMIDACPRISRRTFANRVWRKLEEFKLSLAYLKALYNQIDDFKLRCVPRIFELSEGIYDCLMFLREQPRYLYLGRAMLNAQTNATLTDISYFVEIAGWSKNDRFINRYLDIAEKTEGDLGNSFLIQIVHRGTKAQSKRAMDLIFGKDRPELSVIEDLVDSVPRKLVGLIDDVWRRIVSSEPDLQWFKEFYSDSGVRRYRAAAAKHILTTFEITDSEFLAELYCDVPKHLRQRAVEQICALEAPDHESLRTMISFRHGVGRQMLLDKLHGSSTALTDEDRCMFVTYDESRRVEYARAALASSSSSHRLLMAVVEHAPKQSRRAAAKLSKDKTFLSSVRGLRFVLEFMSASFEAAITAHKETLNSTEYYELWNIINLLHQREETTAKSLVIAAAERVFKLRNSEWEVSREAYNMIVDYPLLVDLACGIWLRDGGGFIYYGGRSNLSPDYLLMIMEKSPSNRQHAFEKIISKNYPDDVLDRVVEVAPEFKAKVVAHRRKQAKSTAFLLEQLFSA